MPLLLRPLLASSVAHLRRHSVTHCEGEQVCLLHVRFLVIKSTSREPIKGTMAQSSGANRSPGSTSSSTTSNSQSGSGGSAASGGGPRRGRRSRGSAVPAVGLTSRHFRLARIKRYLRLHSRAPASSPRATHAIATFIEVVLEEILHLAKRATLLAKRGKIINRHVYLAIKSTDWLGDLFSDSIIPDSGVAPSQLPPVGKQRAHPKLPTKESTSNAGKSQPERQNQQAKGPEGGGAANGAQGGSQGASK